MSQPTPLNPVEQDALVKQIGLALMQTAPEGWQQVTAEYRAAGRYFELSAEVSTTDGQIRAWTAPQETAQLFARLRTGMYRDGKGTWSNARYQLTQPSNYNLDFDRDAPRWQSPPPPQAYLDELHFFPRTEDNVPEWLANRTSQSQGQPSPQQSQASQPNISVQRFRTARIFDGPGPDGRPSVNRPAVDPAEIDKLLRYLEGAPVALTSPNFDVDRLATETPERIPVAFHTDGVWVWPAAVIFYLARYRVSPEIELVQHIRSCNFQLQEVEEQTRQAAGAQLSSMVPGGKVPSAASSNPSLPAVPVLGGLPEQAAPQLADATTMIAPIHRHAEAEAEQTSYVPQVPGYEAATPEPAQQPDLQQPVQLNTDDQDSSDSNAHISRELSEFLYKLLADLGIPAQAYRIGKPAPNTWYLEQVSEGWQVGWYEHGYSTPMLFDNEHDAVAFLLGKLLLDGKQAGDSADNPSGDFADEPSNELFTEQPALVAQEPSTVQDVVAASPSSSGGSYQWDEDLHDVATQQVTTHQLPTTDVPSVPPLAAVQPAHRAPEPQPSSPRPEDWPIQPLRGEPPLTLFRGKRLAELPVGIEIDRFGHPDGNLVYAAGTPFARRSLVPEWVNRPYQVYRVQLATTALAGVAVPWFGQPGGGTAYMLPRSIEDLLADGTLVKVDFTGEPPTGA